MINRIITAIRTESDMKRILLSVLAIALCLSLFSGCDQKPGDNEGKRLPIVMTIAEALPSCAAFEYKDEKPYCLYAYDDDGKLYRNGTEIPLSEGLLVDSPKNMVKD
jgi:hypothetical protein